jgi:very-short-patch-repair endonuclease
MRAWRFATLSRMADEPAVEPLRGAKTRVRPLEQEIAELAKRQHGVVGRAQLLKLGLGRRAIGSRIARGWLHPVHRGVYAVGYALLFSKGRWMAAVIACGAEAALSHRSAGRLWGLVPLGPGPVEVTRPSGFRAQRSGIVGHESLLPEDEVTAIDEIPVTSAPRTLFDLAALLDKRQLERAMNEAEVQRLTDVLSLLDLLKRYPRRRGATTLRALLEAKTPESITRSELEERFVAFLDCHRLPRPRLNADLAVRGRAFRIDCLWEEQRVIVELDGRAVHGTAKAFESDRQRDRILLVEGWHSMRVTWLQLRDEALAIAADLRELLREEGRPLTL